MIINTLVDKGRKLQHMHKKSSFPTALREVMSESTSSDSGIPWWKKRQGSSTETSTASKKPKPTKDPSEKLAFLECLASVKDGKRMDERTAYACRNDTTSIKRCKDRWHVGKDTRNVRLCLLTVRKFIRSGLSILNHLQRCLLYPLVENRTKNLKEV